MQGATKRAGGEQRRDKKKTGCRWPGLPTLAAALLLAAACDDTDENAAFFPVDLAGYTLVRDCRFSIDHDGTSITVWANELARPGYVAGTFPLPAGAILVKQLNADGACGDVQGFVAMRKTEDGTWQWQTANASGAVTAADAQRCLRCHTTCTAGRDLTCTDP